MMLRSFLTLLVATGCSLLYGQEIKPQLDKSTAIFQLKPTSMDAIPPAAFLLPDANSLDWEFSIANIRGIQHPGSPEKEAIKALKKEKGLLKAKNPGPTVDDETEGVLGAAPIKLRNFEGNAYNLWFPPDNTLAIANNGFIVSVVNSNIRFYNENGTVLLNQTLGSFFTTLGLTDFYYDPRVIFDSDQQKFILVALHSNTPSDNKIVISFSKTQDPMQGWWTYSFDGNFLGNNTWFDFPSIGVSNEDLFISGNLFNANNTFNQAAILQIDKQPGFIGGNIAWEFFNNVTNGQGGQSFTVAPASYGFQGAYGPGTYLVSTSSGGGNFAHLYDITGNVEDQQEIFAYEIPTAPYSPSADAEQQLTAKLLDVGDCRVASCFYADGIIHYVHLIDFGGGYGGFRYNRMDVAASSITHVNFGQNLFDHAYPSIAPIGTTPTSKSVVAAFLRSSKSGFPEFRAISFDEAMDASSSILIKSGEFFINVNAENVQRWGDYSGISRKHSASSPVLWLSGCYGKQNSTYGSWISEITLDPNASVREIPNLSASNVFPNPVIDEFTLEWDLREASNLHIFLSSADGKLIRSLYRGRARAGLNRLSFNKGALSPGLYFLIIQDDERQTVSREKIIVAN